MPETIKARNFYVPLAALLLAAASALPLAWFESDRPGADLAPVGAAASLVEVFQGSRAIMWSSLSGSVAYYRLEGWPETIGGNDLGGALVMERVEDTSGVIDAVEKPRRLGFAFAVR